MNIIDILREIFSATDEQTAAFSEAMKKNNIFTASEENMDIRYNKLKGDHEAAQKQLGDANALIEDMKKSTKGQEALQGKITAYEGQVEQLQAALRQEKIKADIKISLLASKATDVDYLAFKLDEEMKSNNEEFVLDDNEHVKGMAEKVEGLKTRFPMHFEASGENKDGYQVFEPNALRKPDGAHDAPTRDSFKKMNYEQRVALKQKNEVLYRQFAKG